MTELKCHAPGGLYCLANVTRATADPSPDKMLYLCSLLVCLLGAVWAQDGALDGLWSQYKAQYGKTYSHAEEQPRRLIWEKNAELIRRHNLEYDLGMQTYTMGINEYSDLTFREYGHYLLGARQDLRNAARESSRLVFNGDMTGRALPDKVDWRDKGYVTPIKNQGQCGSCWAFSSTGAMEAAHFKATGNLVSLSEQQLVDCCKSNAGCNGGWMDNAFQYVRDNGGIDTETYYPYQYRETGRCTYNDEDVGAHVYSWVDVKSGNETALQAAVALNGPIAVAIDANHTTFMNYRSGIYFDSACSHTATDHAVLVVGYGTENGYDYWLVKNSWGTSWGMDGYIMMARNYDNMCAIATFASYPQDRPTGN